MPFAKTLAVWKSENFRSRAGFMYIRPFRSGPAAANQWLVSITAFWSQSSACLFADARHLAIAQKAVESASAAGLHPRVVLLDDTGNSPHPTWRELQASAAHAFAPAEVAQHDLA